MRPRDFTERTRILALGIRVFCAIVCLGSLFVPFATGLRSAIAADSGSVITNYGPAFAFLFCGQIGTGYVAYTAKGVAVLGTIAYTLSCLAIVLLLVQFFIYKKKCARFLALGAAAMVLVSAIMMLFVHDSAAVLLADSILGRHSDSVAATMIRNTSLEFGFWGMSLFGFIAGALLLSTFVLDGTVDEIRTKVMGR